MSVLRWTSPLRLYKVFFFFFLNHLKPFLPILTLIYHRGTHGSLHLHTNKCMLLPLAEKTCMVKFPVAHNSCNWSCFLFVLFQALDLQLRKKKKKKDRGAEPRMQTRPCGKPFRFTDAALKWSSSYLVSAAGGTKYLFSLP